MKSNRLFLFCLLLFILVFGCNAPTVITTPTPGSRPTTPEKLPTVSDTPVPTFTATSPTLKHPPLNTSGPYLAYQDQEGFQTVIKLLDGDGMGQASFSYPSNAASYNMDIPISNVISPDGKWLAYYSGSSWADLMKVAPGSVDVTLNLMSLADGTSRVLTPLLSKDFPNAFTEAAQQLGQVDLTADALRSAFFAGIKSLDWSPDGRYLAFAGQMDGLSSDLYLYDAISGTIKRLSSGPEEVQWITWSPDGKWILDGSSYTVGEGMQYNIYATSVDGTKVNQLSNGTPQVVTSEDWLDEHTYFDSNSANGPGDYDLKLVDVNTGKTSVLWKGSYRPFAFVPYGHWVALFANTPDWPYPYTGGNFQTGIFLIDTTTLLQTRVNSIGSSACCYPPMFEALGHSEDRLFLIKNDNSQEVQYLSSDGKLTEAGIEAANLSVSPDRLKWIAISTNIQIFTEDGSLIRTVDLPANLDPQAIGSIVWRQDSSGLFFTYNEIKDQNSSLNLYVLDLAKGTTVQVDSLSPSGPENFFWVAGSK